MKIYVSSTSIDLTEYREAVITAIRKLGHTCVGMEDYGAENPIPAEECLEDVSDCNVYIGIFAWRYGFIPDGRDCSITELEYREAIKHSIPTLIFLLDEDVAWSSKYIDRGEQRERIETLRDELKKNNVVIFFDSPDDLRAKASLGILELKEAKCRALALEAMHEEMFEARCQAEDPKGLDELRLIFEEAWKKSNEIQAASIPKMLGSIIESARKNIRTVKSRLSSQEAKIVTSVTPPTDSVDCTVFAPLVVYPDDQFLIQVFAHGPELVQEVKELAKEFDSETERRGFKSLEAEVVHGSKLDFHLIIPGIIINDAIQSLTWFGNPESVQFSAFVPNNLKVGNVIGAVYISQDGIPIGHIKFKLTVKQPIFPGGLRGFVSGGFGPRGDEAHFYKQAFISYASQDRTEVLKRVQMLARLQIKFFQDVIDLEPGERWEQKLYHHIDESDLFLLFWSSSASQSKWVMEEVRYALKRKGGEDLNPPEIMPVIIEGPPIVPPPDELKHLHFNDYMLYFMKE